MSGLYLSNLSLSHFRSHRRVALELHPGPIAIYGPNGAGKTNILEAVSLLSPGRGLRRAQTDDLIRRPEALGWKIRADLNSLHHIHELETWAEPESSRQVKIDGKAAPQIALGRVGRMLWLVPSMDRLWIEGAEGRRRFLDRATMSFEPKHADAVLAYEKAMRERNRLLKDMVRDAHWYTALEAQMSDAALEISANRSAAVEQLMTAQAEAETPFPIADLAVIQSDETALPETAEAFRASLSDNRARDLAAGRTLIGPHRSDLLATYRAKGVAARDCSTGEQKALLISLVLANARALARDFGAPPIVLLDEVAAHLDATRRAALYDEICALGAQAFMTGTGVELFEELQGKAQFVEIAERDGQSIVLQEGSNAVD